MSHVVKPLAVVVAGGTGGHINAALALGEGLSERDYSVSFLTGKRPLDYKLFAGTSVTHLASWPLRTKNPFKLTKSVVGNLLTFLGILQRFIAHRPKFVIGCGGYVCGPTLLAAKLLGVPVFIIEQNAVMGLTNRLLAKFSDLIFVHFQHTKGISQAMQSRVRVVGNPTRKSITPIQYQEHKDLLKVLAFGGSLGAEQLNRAVEKIAQENWPFKLHIVHQTGRVDNPVLTSGKDVTYQSSQYLNEIQNQYAWCDVVIARAGASTISELRIVGHPCFLIPFPQATDDHQRYNAQCLKQEVGFTVEIVDPTSSDDEIAARLRTFLQLAVEGKLQRSQNPPVGVNSSQRAIEEIFAYVGFPKTR